MRGIYVYEIKTGLILRWWKYVIVFVPVILMILVELAEVNYCVKEGIYTTPSFGNFLFQWQKGMLPLRETSQQRQLVFPSEWLIFYVSYFMLITGYAKRNFMNSGHQLLLRVQSRRKWWNAKVLWLVLSTVCFCGIFYLLLILASLCVGNTSLTPASDIWMSEVRLVLDREMLVTLFVIPFLTLLLFGMLQLFFELILSPLIGIALCCGILLAGVYWCVPFLFGNYTMLIRNSRVIGSGGVNTGWGLVWYLVCGVILYGVSSRYVQKIEL